MLHVKPVPPTPSVTRGRRHFSHKARATGLAVHVSTVAAQLGNTITGWLLSELTAKSAQENLNSQSTYTLKKSNGESLVSSGPKALFYTPKESAPASPGQLTIPLGRKLEVKEEEKEEDKDEEIITTVELPRPPPPARTSPPPVHITSFPPRKSPPAEFTESLPIAPKQLLLPLEPTPKKSVSQRKPTPIHIVKPPSPNDELDILPKLSLPFSDLSYSSALDSPPSQPIVTPPTPLVPASSHFEKPAQRPRFSRTPSTSLVTRDGFEFDFAPPVPEKDSHVSRSRNHKRPRRGATLECMQEMMLEYVEMRRNAVAHMARNQRFPVAGQLMCATDCGSVYSFRRVNSE